MITAVEKPKQTLTTLNWHFGQTLLFRFFFIYLSVQMADSWLSFIPYSNYLTQYYYQLTDWAVQTANANLFHIREVLVYPMGSGDTSWNWTWQWLTISIALIGCVIWTVADWKRGHYKRLNFWLCLFVRYYVALTAFTYGIIKIFALQMSFPSLSQMATPLGDFLPMRLCWMFMGYSTTYQAFTGVMETAVGLLLLYRPTATLGALLATFVFANVMMLNLSYDIPVKLFSTNMVVACLYLLSNEFERLMCFFVWNKPADACSIYHYNYSPKWMRIGRVVLKTVFVLVAVIVPFYMAWQQYSAIASQTDTKPFRSGVYEVASFAINNTPVQPSPSDNRRWQDVIFEKNGNGSIKTLDTLFTQRYKRGYFTFSVDSTKQMIDFRKRQTDSVAFKGVILSMRYQLVDSSSIKLWGKQKNDSLHVLLKRTNRQFPLAKKQFHWLSEYNR
ncbi:hypothetical protein GCM10023187_22460 [Nibrella viscosa]|uniref:DoxX family protein n=1 Tax=Nibrella viscosa TaxID=1084524 RepID=A0ABP8KDN7_9BACT